MTWLSNKSKWEGIKSIGMVETVITKGEKIAVERRYYISSLAAHIDLFMKAVCGHWAIESMHWHLDVTFKEDANTTIDKNAAMKRKYYSQMGTCNSQTDRTYPRQKIFR
ncbi:ISAs1 family transposase [Treponema phagedenis]|uniref:ISAs1 family transposase n=2 Tax=Treponema phagedenis TaxID=162 RepID=A0AAE6IUW4_TREPH|nr:ISAs1 family transposase [Treponema phagedenis]QEJ95263.1 ISAs1 family transposase [Treponema phagedenis]QEJ98366.1 ISAs1 family transposase [Treponema phagedenis]QEK01116.1 ISAs1 family transposase [Treponema phagedenis]QEK03876.1 ISAs1 family transposase [Treponema phagedenis]